MVVLEIFSVPSAWISSSMAIIHRFFSFSGVWKASRILLVLLKSNVRAIDVMKHFCYLSFHPSYSVLSMIPSIGKTFHLSFGLTYYIFQLWHLFCLIFFQYLYLINWIPFLYPNWLSEFIQLTEFSCNSSGDYPCIFFEHIDDSYFEFLFGSSFK